MKNESERLCQQCGMCCDGTLFLTTPLAPDESGRLSERRLHVVSTERGPRLPQPCSQHSAFGCGIYSERPKVCRSFRCAALINFEAGQQSYSDCVEQVEKVRGLAAELEKLLGWAPGSYSVLAYQEWWENQQASLGRATALRVHGKALLKAGTLHVLIKRDFTEEHSTMTCK